MKLRLEHLPADALGLREATRAAFARGPAFAPLPVARAPAEIPRPEERHDRATRRALAERLRARLEALDPPTRVLSSLRVLAEEGVFAVVTGQQPGLFAAPLFSLYKALQACRLAAELAGRWGVPVVPIFWNHGDDHDVAEVHHAWQLNRNLDVQKVGLAGLSSGRVPIGSIVLEEERHRLGAVRGAVRQLYEEHAHVDEALELFAPRPGETLASALTRAFTDLFGEHGLVVLEPDWIREELGGALARIVPCGLAEGLAAGDELLAREGLGPAIEPAGAALVFHLGAEGRRPLRLGGEGLRYDGEPGSRTAHELAAEIVADPRAWSAGALLRPLVQDAVLPVATYVGGRGELAYHAQLGPLRERAALPRTPFTPRISCTLVDGETRRSLERLGLDLRTAFAARGASGAQDEQDSPEVAHALRASVARFREELAGHRAALAELDPALAGGLARTAAQVAGLVEKVAVKAERVHANKGGKGRRHARRVANVLFPRGEPQERVLGPLQPTARHGRAWIEALWDELPPISLEHVVVQFEDDGPAGEEEA